MSRKFDASPSSFVNIKFDYCKCNGIHEKVNLRSDFKKYYTSLAGARTHKSFILVDGKKSKCTSHIMNTFLVIWLDESYNIVIFNPMIWGKGQTKS